MELWMTRMHYRMAKRSSPSPSWQEVTGFGDAERREEGRIANMCALLGRRVQIMLRPNPRVTSFES